MEQEKEHILQICFVCLLASAVSAGLSFEVFTELQHDIRNGRSATLSTFHIAQFPLQDELVDRYTYFCARSISSCGAILSPARVRLFNF